MRFASPLSLDLHFQTRRVPGETTQTCEGRAPSDPPFRRLVPFQAGDSVVFRLCRIALPMPPASSLSARPNPLTPYGLTSKRLPSSVATIVVVSGPARE